jgi:hypothetical protein
MFYMGHSIALNECVVAKNDQFLKIDFTQIARTISYFIW